MTSADAWGTIVTHTANRDGWNADSEISSGQEFCHPSQTGHAAAEKGRSMNDTTEQIRALREKNTRVLAERLGWPEGAAEGIIRLEATYPDYSAFYDTVNKTYRVYYLATSHTRDPMIEGATLEATEEAIKADVEQRAANPELTWFKGL